MTNKQELRSTILKRLENIQGKIREEKNNKIFKKLVKSKYIKQSNNIMCFVSFRDEVDTINFIRYLFNEGKNVYIPVVDKIKKEMYISKIESFMELKEGYYGVLEPIEKYLRVTDPKVLDIIITPGVAYNKKKFRIGYGAGFYDKFFANKNITAKKIGICFKEQLADFTPQDHDKKVDILITD